MYLKYRAAEALDHFVPINPLPPCRFDHYPWLMEELRKTKWEKWHLKHCWRSTRVRTSIKTYLVIIRIVKWQYFSALIAFTNSCLVTLLRVIWGLLGKENSEVYLQCHAEEFAKQLWEKLAQFCFQLHLSFGTGPLEMPEHSLVWFEPVGPEKLGRPIMIVSSDIWSLDHWSWLGMRSSYYVKCHGVQHFLPSCLTSTQSHWVRSFVIMGWGIISSIHSDLVPNLGILLNSGLEEQVAVLTRSAFAYFYVVE